MEKRHCRLIIDGPRDGPTNMAADEWLLRSVADRGDVALRFYSWDRPTLSLGYFQRFSQRSAHSESAKCAIVRRASGGGAILHHRELTYSFAVPIADRIGALATLIYDLFHETLIETLGEFGVPTRVADSADAAAANSGAFLCFQRRSAGDVILGDWKVAGSAQRRHADALLQHGSILLKRSEFAPELPGINDLGDHEILGNALIGEWVPRVASRQNLEFSENTPFTKSEHEQIAGICRNRFAKQDWLCRR